MGCLVPAHHSKRKQAATHEQGKRDEGGAGWSSRALDQVPALCLDAAEALAAVLAISERLSGESFARRGSSRLLFDAAFERDFWALSVSRGSRPSA